jgi:predicted transcriptional regulator
MRTEYENMVKEFLPALRASAARKMRKDYKMNQAKIAGLLDTTQAAVSKYLSGSYSADVKRFEKTLSDMEVSEFVREMMKGRRYEAQRSVCKMCSRNLSFRCGLMIK